MTKCVKYKQNNNSTNLQQVDGGFFIKQGDMSSLIAYRLLDENHQPVMSLEGKKAYVHIVKGTVEPKIVYETESLVRGGQVEFTINDIMPVGVLWVEIMVDGYVFPSDHKTTLKVVQSGEEYEVESLVKKGLGDELDLLYEVAQKLDDLDISKESEVNGIEIPDLLTFYNIAKI